MAIPPIPPIPPIKDHTKLNNIGMNTHAQIDIAISINDITYDDLVTAIGNSALVKGVLYRITDYATVHYIVDGDNTRYNDIITGATEPLIVRAIDVNKIDKQAYSQDYPNDIIYYDWNPANWQNDPSFFDVENAPSQVVVSGFKGVIYFRHDTVQDNSMGYDFRNCKFRRWQVDVADWVTLTAYTKGDMVKDGGYLYKAIKDVPNTPEILTSDANYWIILLSINITDYWNPSPSSWNGIPSGAGYDDFLTFVEGSGFATYSQQVFGNTFEKIKMDTVIYDKGDGLYRWKSLLPNNVFFLLDDNFKYIIGNFFGVNFNANTMLNMTGNVVDTGFFGNQIDTDFINNAIGNNFYNNLIGNAFRDNFLETEIYSNFIGSGFQKNSVGSFIYYNYIANQVAFNRWGNDFGGNTFGTINNYNILENDFINNIIADNFSYNTIGGNCSTNILGSGCKNNNIGTLFSNNTIVDGFENNRVENDFNINKTVGVDFTSATYVYSDYNKTLYRRPDGSQRLRYLDDSDALVVVAANA